MANGAAAQAGIGRGLGLAGSDFANALLGILGRREDRERWATAYAEDRAWREHQAERQSRLDQLASEREGRLQEQLERGAFTSALSAVAGAGTPEMGRALAGALGPTLAPEYQRARVTGTAGTPAGPAPLFSNALLDVAGAIPQPQPDPNRITYRDMQFESPDDYLRFRGREAAVTRAPTGGTAAPRQPGMSMAQYVDLLKDQYTVQDYDPESGETVSRLTKPMQAIIEEARAMAARDLGGGPPPAAPSDPRGYGITPGIPVMPGMRPTAGLTPTPGAAPVDEFAEARAVVAGLADDEARALLEQAGYTADEIEQILGGG